MIPSTTNSKSGPHTGNGSTTTWDFAFKVFSGSEFSDSNIRIILTDANGVETDITSNYSTALNANQDTNPGGTLTYPVSGTAITSSDTITITSNVPITQGTDYQQGGVFNAQTVEDRLDWLTLGLKQLSEIQKRSIRFPISVDGSLGTEIPIAQDKILSLDEDGSIVATRELGTFKGQWESGKRYVTGDMVKATTALATSSYSVFWCKTNHMAVGAVPLDTNIGYSNWEQLLDAEQVSLSTAQAVAAAASATLASEWATKTDGVVSGSEYSAKHHAQLGSQSSSSAEGFKDSAEVAKASAETTLTELLKLNLGAKSTLPTTDNSGETLLIGAVCVLTTDVKQYVWNGSYWSVSSTPIHGVLQDYTFTLTANQTVISGADNSVDADGNPAPKTLYINNASLVREVCYGNSVAFVTLDSSDYTIDAVNNTITLSTGAEAGKKLSFVVFGDYSAQSADNVHFGGGTIEGMTFVKDTTGNVRSGRKNLIINGDMQVIRDATSGSGAGYTIAKFRTNGLITSWAQTGSQLDVLQFVTQAGTGICQRVESKGAGFYAGNTYTLSFLVNPTIADVEIGITFRNGNSYLSDVFAVRDVSSQVTAGAYSKVEHTFTLAVDADPLTYVNHNMQVYIGSSVINTINIKELQLERGLLATEFEKERSYGENLALCQWYYQIVSYVGYVGVSTCHAHSGGNAGTAIRLVSSMRATPSFSYTGTNVSTPSGGAVNLLSIMASDAVNGEVGLLVDCVVGIANGDTLMAGTLTLEFDADL